LDTATRADAQFTASLATALNVKITFHSCTFFYVYTWLPFAHLPHEFYILLPFNRNAIYYITNKNELLTEKTTLKLPSNVETQSVLLEKVMLMMLQNENAFPCGKYKIFASEEKQAII
jgi:hypothetical protein